LKQTNDLSVLATFNYEVKSYMRMTKGDRQTLAREAEAIAALATDRLAISSCRACGTKITDESHFCRRCGAPLVLEVPELEVLRLTKGTRGSFHNIVGGMIALLIAAVPIAIVFAVSGVRISGPLLWIAIPLVTYALFLLAQGTTQLHRTLNSKASKNLTLSPQPRLAASVTTALPAPRNASITEGTTELLLPNREVREAEPVRRKDPTTAEIDADGLM
jgi:hypothetical protein